MDPGELLESGMGRGANLAKSLKGKKSVSEKIIDKQKEAEFRPSSMDDIEETVRYKDLVVNKYSIANEKYAGRKGYEDYVKRRLDGETDIYYIPEYDRAVTSKQVKILGDAIEAKKNKGITKTSTEEQNIVADPDQYQGLRDKVKGNE
jgi:hypothetical protein